MTLTPFAHVGLSPTEVHVGRLHVPVLPPMVQTFVPTTLTSLAEVCLHGLSRYVSLKWVPEV